MDLVAAAEEKPLLLSPARWQSSAACSWRMPSEEETDVEVHSLPKKEVATRRRARAAGRHCYYSCYGREGRWMLMLMVKVRYLGEGRWWWIEINKAETMDWKEEK